MKRNDNLSGGGSARAGGAGPGPAVGSSVRPYDSRGPPPPSRHAHRGATVSNQHHSSNNQQYRSSSHRTYEQRRRDRSRSRSPDNYNDDDEKDDDDDDDDEIHHHHHRSSAAFAQRQRLHSTTTTIGSTTLTTAGAVAGISAASTAIASISSSTGVISNDPQLEHDRRSRMARLRAENEEEERRLAALDLTTTTSQDSGQHLSHHYDPKSEIIQVDPSELEGLTEEEQMQRLLGFGGFSSTKGQAVADNQSTAARGAATKHKARKYRQYMNRKGGFNRPLDKMD